MKSKRLSALIVGTLLVGLSTLAFPDFVEAQPIVELAYDDGIFDGHWNTGNGGQQAVRFSLPAGWDRAKLLTAKYAVHDPGLKFRVHIYGRDQKTDLTQPFEVTPPQEGWFEVDLSRLNIIVSGDFYVAKEGIISGGLPNIYIDFSPPIDYRTYRMMPGQDIWYATWFDGCVRAIVEEVGTAIPATIDFDPDTLNIASKGRWVTAYVEFPPGYDVNNVNVEKILLDDALPVAEDAPTSVGDHDSDDIPDLMVKFSRTDVTRHIESMDWDGETKRFRELTLKISGVLHSGEMFEGSDTITVIFQSFEDSKSFSTSLIDSRLQEVGVSETGSDSAPSPSESSDLTYPCRKKEIIQPSSTFPRK